MNILLCTLGLSWAVIPEIYGWLRPELELYKYHPQRQDIEELCREHELGCVDELWVCTTQGQKTAESMDLLLAWWDLLKNPIPLRIWSAEGTDQLANQRECEHFRELVFRLTLKASEMAGRGGQVLLSLAGGRKTMSADMQRAASLFGVHRLLHVVDSGDLPKELRTPTPQTMASSIAPDVMVKDGIPALMPLVVGAGMYNELLGVNIVGKPRISAEHFPVPQAKDGEIMAWPMPTWNWLFREIDERERAGGALLGNYLAAIAEKEHHENWRQLYRLPTRTINQLRETLLTEEHRNWLDRLPKADLHRHLGGCLDVSAQKQVAESVWGEMNTKQRDDAYLRIKGWLGEPEWPWLWPNRLKTEEGEPAEVRSFRAAALLLHATEEQLHHNLWGVTEPRVGLVQKHPHKFAAYERPGELTGSAILQHEAAIEPYAAALVEQACAEHLSYLELRGSPDKYLGGRGQEFVRQLEQAIQRSLQQQREKADAVECTKVGGIGPIEPMIRCIVILDRRITDEQAIKRVVELAVNEQDRGFVVGIDLAGDEKHARNKKLAGLLHPAFEACIPITIHAGEGQSPENIWEAAYHLHADRIGHGLTLLRKPELIRRFRDRGICLELCPSSNREVVGFCDAQMEESLAYPQYPLAGLWQEGLAFAICTDNPGISRTTLANEFLTAARMSPEGISQWDALTMLKQAFTYAFLTSAEREVLLKRIDQQLYELLRHP